MSIFCKVLTEVYLNRNVLYILYNFHLFFFSY